MIDILVDGMWLRGVRMFGLVSEGSIWVFVARGRGSVYVGGLEVM